MTADHLDYDHVIVGGGVSGLTLAYHLADRTEPATRILLVDKDDDPNYNISFWSTRDTPFEPVMQKSWHTIQVRHGDRRTVCPLSRYRLRAFWRDDFDAYLRDQLAEHASVTMLEASATRVTDEGDHVVVDTSSGPVTARWAFDSRSSMHEIREDDPDLLLMQGLAAEVECGEPVFDPEEATLFDFLLTTPTFDFMYVLPYTERHGLVNVAFVTPFDTSVKRETCQGAIRDYIADRLGCADFQVVKECYGRLPLASGYPTRDPTSRVVPIGVRAGMIKASTSYAFTRILHDAKALTAALQRTGMPYYDQRRPWFYRATDKSTARVFHDAPGLAQEVMFSMFTAARGDMALEFLDERLSFRDHGSLFGGVPRDVLLRFLHQVLVGAVRRY